MFGKLGFTIFSCLFFVCHLSAEIIECTSFQEIKTQIPKNSLLFLEIDNILIRPEEEVATTAFFDYLKQKSLIECNDPDRIANKLYPLWVKVQMQSKAKPLDRDFVSFLTELQNQNVEVLALSHRGPQLAYHTLDILHKNKLFLSPALDYNHIIEPDLATFYEGMLLLHPVCDKGEYLAKFLSSEKLKSKRVVFVDYQLVNLVRVSQVMEELNIPFLGIYFRDSVSDISDYTIQIGTLQLEYMNQILSDLTAKILLEKS